MFKSTELTISKLFFIILDLNLPFGKKQVKLVTRKYKNNNGFSVVVRLTPNYGLSLEQ